MGSLWTYIEGMDGISLHFMETNSSDLAAWAGFGTCSTLFERRLLLQYDLVLPNSSTHVATLYLGPMGSLWAYIEGMDGIPLHFTATNSSDLAAWARFGTLTLFERRLLLQYDLVLPNSSTHVATLYLGPMRSLWACIEGMDVLPLTPVHSDQQLRFGRLGQVWHFDPLQNEVCSSSMTWCCSVLLRMLQHCIWDP